MSESAPACSVEEFAREIGEDPDEVRETVVEILRYHEPERAAEVKRGESA